MRLTDPLRIAGFEDRWAFGAESHRGLAREFGIDHDRMERHFQNHCDPAAVLRRAHGGAGSVETVESLLLMMVTEGSRPLQVGRRQVEVYMRLFDDARQRGDAEARDMADRRLYQWAALENKILQPLTSEFRPRQATNNVQNNVVLADQASGASGFGALLGEFEERLALHPPEKRGELITYLRNGEAAIDAPALDAPALEASAEPAEEPAELDEPATPLDSAFIE
jgi:hypothetical protein